MTFHLSLYNQKGKSDRSFMQIHEQEQWHYWSTNSQTKYLSRQITFSSLKCIPSHICICGIIFVFIGVLHHFLISVIKTVPSMCVMPQGAR